MKWVENHDYLLLENFTFKSQRRSTSNLSLAFYVQGSIDSITNECCEYKCIQTNANNTEQKQFFFKSIQKPNPCEKYNCYFFKYHLKQLWFICLLDVEKIMLINYYWIMIKIHY